MDDGTTRERIEDALREAPATVTELAGRVDAPRSAVYRDLRHVARSVESGDGRFLVAPPECRDCGFADFDDPVDRPSRCPACRSENLDPAVFKIEPVD